MALTNKDEVVFFLPKKASFNRQASIDKLDIYRLVFFLLRKGKEKRDKLIGGGGGV